MLPIKQTKSLIFPIILSNGSHTLTESIDSIKASIKLIISWPLRTRQFNGEFGSRIFEVLEEPSDDILISLVRRFIIDAIAKWESRVELISLDIHKSEPQNLNISLVYRVKELDIQDSLFYTYYIN